MTEGEMFERVMVRGARALGVAGFLLSFSCSTSDSPPEGAAKDEPTNDGGGGADSGGATDGGRTDGGPIVPNTKPGAGNTGVPAGVTLTPYSGPCTISTAGTVVDSADVTCELIVAAPNVTVRKSRLRRGVLVRVTTGTTIEDTTLEAGASISSSSKITLRRNDLHGPGDGLHVTSDNGAMCEDIVIERNWIHGPEIGPGDHYDVMQVRGVRKMTVRGNNLDAGKWVEVAEGGTNAVVFFEDANGGNDTVEVDGNWLNGGGYMIYTSAANARFTNNRVGRDHHFGLLYTPFVAFTESGNTYEDDGKPVRFQP